MTNLFEPDFDLPLPEGGWWPLINMAWRCWRIIGPLLRWWVGGRRAAGEERPRRL